MLDKKLLDLICNFLSDKYVEKMSYNYTLFEKGNNEGQGRSLLRLNVGSFDNICVLNYDKKDKCEFLVKKWGMRKCVDHLILRYHLDAWELHMIEMKSKVRRDNWEAIKEKFRASYWNIQIFTKFLGISFDLEKVFLYTTYEREDMSIKKSSNPRGNNLMLGEYIPDAEKEWNGEILTSIRLLPYDNSKEALVKFQHTKIPMIRSINGECLEGSYDLNSGVIKFLLC